MDGILADEPMGQQARSGATTLDRARRQRGLHEPFANQAQVSRGRTIRFTMKRPGTYSSSSFGTAFKPVAGSCVTILADPAQLPAAVGTGIRAGRQFHLHARDMIRDRTALRFFLLLDVGKLHLRGHRGGRERWSQEFVPVTKLWRMTKD